jgi:ribose transport system substrate-binding protein
VAELFGCTIMRASDDFTPDKETENVQNFVSAGVDGVALQAAGVTNLPRMAEILQNGKTPFVLFTFIGAADVRAQLAESNPYYVGSVDNDLIGDGRVVAQMALDAGRRNAVIIGGNIGDSTQDLRVQGFTEVFEAGGGKVLSVARCTDASEAPTKAQDMLSANKNADCMFAMVGDYVPASVSALEALGMTEQVNLYMSGVDKHSAEYIKNGSVIAGADGLFLASFIAPTLLLNYLDGHPIKDENGKAPELLTKPFEVNASNVDAYISIFGTDGVSPIADETLKNLCWRNNPDVSYQDYVDLIENGLSLNALLKAHGLPEVD